MINDQQPHNEEKFLEFCPFGNYRNHSAKWIEQWRTVAWRSTCTAKRWYKAQHNHGCVFIFCLNTSLLHQTANRILTSEHYDQSLQTNFRYFYYYGGFGNGLLNPIWLIRCSLKTFVYTSSTPCSGVKFSQHIPPGLSFMKIVDRSHVTSLQQRFFKFKNSKKLTRKRSRRNGKWLVWQFCLTPWMK